MNLDNSEEKKRYCKIAKANSRLQKLFESITLIVASIVLSMFVTSSTAYAYSLDGGKWDGVKPITYSINQAELKRFQQNNFGNDVLDPETGEEDPKKGKPTETEIRNAIRGAFTAWETTSGGKLEFKETTDKNGDPEDKTQVDTGSGTGQYGGAHIDIFFKPSSFVPHCAKQKPDKTKMSLAEMNVVGYVCKVHDQNGKMLSVDIYINADALFSIDPENRAKAFCDTTDFQSVMVHEGGHAVGLDDQDKDAQAGTNMDENDKATNKTFDSVMNPIPGGEKKRTPATDDKNGLHKMYNVPNYTPAAPKTISFNIGPSGGSILCPRGIKVEVAEGALESSTELASLPVPPYYDPMAVPEGVSLSAVFFNLYLPEGITLNIPATIAVPYTDNQIASLSESSLQSFVFNPLTSRWEKMAGSTVNTTANTVVFQTNHFSTFALGGSPLLVIPTGYDSSWLIVTAVCSMLAGGYLMIRQKRKFARNAT